MKLPVGRIALGLFVLGLVIFFYLRTNRIVFADHERFSRSVRDLQQLDATLNQNVLKCRLNLLEDYDELPKQIAELKKSVQALSPIPAFISEGPRQVLRKQRAELGLLVDQVDTLQEQFKSLNAVLDNSLRYLPVTGNQLVTSAEAHKGGHELIDLLKEVIRQSLAYCLHTSGEQKTQIDSLLQSLTEWRVRHGDYSYDDELERLADHVRSILQRKPKVDALIAQISEIPIGQRAEEMQHFYDQQFFKAMSAEDVSRTVLYGVCGLLAAAVGYSLFALRSANALLERRVADRTAALSLKNGELEKEIAERHRAERLLAEKKHRLRTILESEPECVKLVDAAGNLLEMNPAGLRMIEAEGLEPILGTPVSCLLAPEYQDLFRELNEAVFRGESRIATFEILGLKGTRRWVETHACPLRNPDGEIFAQLAITRDVTERRRSEAQLAYERDLFQTLLDNIPDLIYFKDLESRFLTGSRALARRFGIESVDEMVGKRDGDFFADEFCQGLRKDEEWIIHTGKSIVGKIEKEVWPDERKAAWMLTTKLPFRDKTGAIIGTFGISKDITAIKEAEMQLESLHKQLLEASRQAGMAEVATSVLHNVGNVLNSVNISCSVLTTSVRESQIKVIEKVANLLEEQSGDLPGFFANDPRGHKLPGLIAQLGVRLTREQESMLKELRQLAEHIDHIKEIVAMQQSYGKVFGVTETLNVVDLVEDSLKMNAGALVRHEVLPIREYGEVPRITVEKHKVLQILVNLIRNAKYACDESGRSDKKVTLRVERGGGQCAHFGHR